MAETKAIKDLMVGKAKRLAGEVLGDQKLHDEGSTQERQGRDERQDSTKPFGNLDKLT
jgi:uncharacterized protein YjbJ (UPF0337 family)